MLDHIRRLHDHLAWADRRAIATLRAAADVEPRAVSILAHVLGAEEVWLARLEGREPGNAVWPELDLDGCERLAEHVHRHMERFLETLQLADMHRVVHYRNSAGVAFESKVSDILFHVALHGSYHRGQVALLARRGGGEPLYTDYIAFARGGAPATQVLDPGQGAAGAVKAGGGSDRI